MNGLLAELEPPAARQGLKPLLGKRIKLTYEDGLVAAPLQMGAVAAPAARLSTGQAATPPDSPLDVAEFIVPTKCNE